MFLKKKSKFKPLYKKFINLRENAQNKRKVLNFKKQKWTRFIGFYRRKLRWYKKFKVWNQNGYLVSRYSNRHTSYKKRYKNTLQSYKIFNLFYGGLKKGFVKNKIKSVKNKNLRNYKAKFLEGFEKRIDVVLYRAKFCHSLRSSQQLIIHGKILVNNRIVRTKSYILKPGDLVSIDLKYNNLIKQNIAQSEMWPIPPKHLIINYKTMQIIFEDIKHKNLSAMFPFYLNLEKVLENFYKQ